MTWVRLDDQFADSPKMEAVGPLAAWLHVAALCYAGRQLTDGLIPATKALRLTNVTAPAKQAKALVDVGAWHAPGHDCDSCPPCPAGHYLIHDYLEYQHSRAEVEADRERERAKKRRQRGAGMSARNGDGTFAGTGESPRESTGESRGVSPGESRGDNRGESPRESRGESLRTHPIPSLTEELTPSYVLTTPGDEPGGDNPDQQPTDQGEPGPTSGDGLLVEAARLAGLAEAERRGTEVANPAGYARSRAKPLLERHRDTWRAMLDSTPGLDAQALADAVTAQAYTPPGEPDQRYDAQQRASRARAEADMGRTRSIARTPPDPRRNLNGIATARTHLRPITGDDT